MVSFGWITVEGAPLSLENTEVVNMRTLTAEQACAALFNTALTPNLPAGKETRMTEAEPAATI